MESITIKAMGKAINKAVACAEIVKRRSQGDLHQVREIPSLILLFVHCNFRICLL